MRKIVLLAAMLVALSAGAATWLYGEWERFVDRPLATEGVMTLWVAPGTSFAGLVGQLEVLGVTRRDWRWRLFGRVHSPTLHAGEYLIPAGTTVAGLVDKLQSGQVRTHRFTIVEGWTAMRLRRELSRDPRLLHVTDGLDGDELMERLGCNDCNPEGRFLPETYFFTRGTSDLELLRRAHEAMERAVAEVWERRADDLPFDSPAELRTLASIIERETGAAGERARVAGVFVRRLEQGMRLQTDPTVLYGLGDDFSGRLRRVHLTTDHPWNTYTRHGLPPTPIALPGRAALEAAANPAPGTALYFVSRGDGTHQFSDSLREHNRAVDRYIRGNH